MGKLIDLTGQKFGTLTVKSKVQKEHSKTTMWLCDCDCGNKNIPKNSQWLRSRKDNAVCSSKCKLKKIGMRSEDLTGQQFGRLTCVKIDEDKTREEREKGRHRTYWKCDCSCGGETSARIDHLKSGLIVSCGCYHEDILKTMEHPIKTNETNVKEDYMEIKSSNSNDVFLIDSDDYDKIKNYYWFTNTNGYAESVERGSNNKKVFMARIIMNCDQEHEVDHINHDIKDNRKKNLRIVTTNQNNWNINKNHLAGIRKNHISNKWEVRINYKLQTIFLGKYDSYEEALDIRDKAEDVFFQNYKYKKE